MKQGPHDLFMYPCLCNHICIVTRKRKVETSLNLRTACKGKLKPLLESAPNTTSKGLGPRAVLKTLDFSTKSLHEINRWREESRIAAITGSCSHSLQSVSSGVRCYIAFAGAFISMWNSVFLLLSLAFFCSRN